MKYKTLAYSQSLALLTDFYQLTMAYGYWKSGVSDTEACFHLFFRNNPFNGGFAVACGLEYVMDYLENFNLDNTDIDYLASLKGNDGCELFDKKFLKMLGKMEFKCDIDAMPEGTIVFPHEPLVRVKGPILQCQIIETALLNIINFQTLIATKSARINIAAKGAPVLEFGLRRAQGIDGSLAAARAAYIGGCLGTSNVLAGKVFGIPVKGTHAHSWVMFFDDELESFKAYAKAMPNNCLFLADTYDTIEGVKKAVEVGKLLRKEGHDLLGIRLDSGDLAYLSAEARKILDDSGFAGSKIIASNELDEYIISNLEEQNAAVDIWGVGTKLITAFDQPALGGVYKLSAVNNGGGWKYKVKLSEQSVKVSNPGIQQVRRYSIDGEYSADVIYDSEKDIDGGCVMIDPFDMTRQRKIAPDTMFTDLLVPVFRAGRRVYAENNIESIKNYVHENLERFHSGIKRFVNPHKYPVGLEKSLFALKTDLILRTREIGV